MEWRQLNGEFTDTEITPENLFSCISLKLFKQYLTRSSHYSVPTLFSLIIHCFTVEIAKEDNRSEVL